MTPEERFAKIEVVLDRLTSRHEALSESVELLTRDIRAMGGAAPAACNPHGGYRDWGCAAFACGGDT
jgi:hypothetical protein